MLALCALALALAMTTCHRSPDALMGSPAEDQGSTTLVEGFRNPDLGNGWQVTESLDLLYAKRFTVDTFEGDYRLLCLADGNRYLVVPEGAPMPQGIADDIVVLQQPIGDGLSLRLARPWTRAQSSMAESTVPQTTSCSSRAACGWRWKVP